MHDAIRDLPGSTPARQLLVSKGLEYLDKLARDAGDRADLQRELAGAYLKVGDVQGRPFNPNLGDTAGALASYRKAVGDLRVDRRRGRAPTRRLRRELATGLPAAERDALGHRRHQGRAGRRPAAASSCCSSRRVRQRQRGRGRPPTSGASWRRATPASAICCRPPATPTGALEHRRRALAMMETVAASAPTTSRTSASSASPTEARKPARQPELSERRRSRGRAGGARAVGRGVREGRGCTSRPTRCSGETWRSPTATSPTC